MLKIRKTKRTKQLELVNENGEVVQKFCRSCQKMKLAQDFPKNSDKNLRADCQECFKEKRSEYYKANKDKKVVYRQRERAVSMGLPSQFTEEDYLKLKAFSNGRCMLSGEAVTLQIDHVQAVSKGWLGSTTGNMILVSEKVNQAKRDKSLFEFLKSEKAKELIDSEQLIRTLKYLAKANEMKLAQYIQFLQDAEELAQKSKEYWR
ncbi:hypothetical protein V7152_23480 [Neobacillus drentensis]|uniref:hypothetical protein n=1 Tax=Neobacillus drentensis TaxID=220684 RepID=UPI002FFD77D6